MKLVSMLRRTILILAAVFLVSARPAQAATIEIWQAGGPFANIFAADTLIGSGPATLVSVYNGLIDFDDLGDGTTGFSALNIPWPGGVNTNFAVRITGAVDASVAEAWGFYLDHDDGVRMRVNGTQIIEFPPPTDNFLSFGSIGLNAGLNFVEIIFYENAGGASLELYGAPMSRCCSTNDLMALQTVPEPATMLLVATGLGAAVRRRLKKRA